MKDLLPPRVRLVVRRAPGGAPVAVTAEPPLTLRDVQTQLAAIVDAADWGWCPHCHAAVPVDHGEMQAALDALRAALDAQRARDEGP